LFSHCSHREDFIDIFRLLVGPSLYPNPRDGEGKKALLVLCSSPDRINDFYKKFAPRLINSGKIDIKAVTSDYSATALHLLCKNYGQDNENNLIDMIRLLIAHGTQVDALDKNGATALHLLCENYQGSNLKAIVQLFISEGIDVHLRDHERRNAVYYLCMNSSGSLLMDAFQVLVDKGADVTELYGKQNALHSFCRYYKGEDMVEVMKLFIQKGVNLTTTDKDGRNALHLLCLFVHHDKNITACLVAILIVHMDKASRTAVDYFKSNALHYLCGNKCLTDGDGSVLVIISLLIDSGIEVNQLNNNGNNALHLLLQNDRYREDTINVIRLLVEGGINLNQLNRSGKNALHLLYQHYHRQDLPESIQIFVDNGVNVEASYYQFANSALD